MFEAQLAYYLDRYLGQYVYGLDARALKVSVFSGDVVLTNLKLKPSALGDLKLPINVKAGLLGSLKLKARLELSIRAVDVQPHSWLCAHTHTHTHTHTT